MITLALFTSTKGHYGHKDIYKTTINSLLKQANFSQKIVHIKRENDDDLIYNEMLNFFTLCDFTVISTFGEWKHNDVSHFVEHAKDIVTLMSHPVVQSSKYVFWLEDDFIFKSSVSMNSLIKEATNLLDQYPSKLSVRFLRDGIDLASLFPTITTGNFFAHKDVFSFNPTILRSRDAWILALNFLRAFHPSIHIERFATESLRPLSNDADPFVCFNIDYAKCVHIGVAEFDKNDYE